MKQTSIKTLQINRGRLETRFTSYDYTTNKSLIIKKSSITPLQDQIQRCKSLWIFFRIHFIIEKKIEIDNDGRAEAAHKLFFS